MNMIKSILITTFIILVAISCKEEDKYGGIVYKNYLSYEINRANTFLITTFEGEEEGKYAPGSKQAYQSIIDQATIVDEKDGATQEEVDLAYQSLLQADSDFYDAMVPFRSAFQPLINYGQYVYDNTSEGTETGNVPAGSKDDLNSALEIANTTINDPNLTQALLEEAAQSLSESIFNFNSSIIGHAAIEITNYSFEEPGYETDGFAEVPGWSTFGTVEEWAPNPGVLLNDSSTDGDYVARIGSYTTGVYQPLKELVNPSSEYVLKADISLVSNAVDWEGNLFPVVLRARLITFNQSAGDYNFISVLSETIDTIGLYPTSFDEIELAVDIDAALNAIGRKMGIDFILRHTFDPQNPIYAESYLSLDNVRLTRKIN